MKKEWLTLAFAIIVLGCRKPYNPPAINAPNGYLVVEGVINPGSDSTIIKLSRTVNISGNVTVNPVTGAVVNVVSDQNASFPLTESGSGNYISPGLSLDVTHQYRLNIKTSDGKQYQSALEQVVITPPIDSIGFNITTVPDTGVQIYVNTHDPTNTIKYYRWDYDENWEFHSRFVSNFISTGTTLALRGPSEYVAICYTSDVSSDIALGSSAKLRQATLYQSPLAFISSKSEKIEARYRISVRQYALSSGAYVFWQDLKKNTEQLGSIFDAQPSQAPGNITCITNPAEPVVGYVGICTVSTKTEEIDERNLPAWVPTYPYTCSLDTAKGPALAFVIDYPDIYLATDLDSHSGNYLYTSRECADCTIRGSLTPPPFWR
jgi:hypothetical protein